MRRRAKLGSQNKRCGSGRRTPGVVERHQQELGIDLELGRQVGSRSEEVEQSDLGDNRQEDHPQLGHQQGRQQREHDPRRPCVGSPLPSCEPSTPFGSP